MSNKRTDVARMTFCFITLLATCLLTTGCGSIRFSTSLRTDPTIKNMQVADGVKFSIRQYTANQHKKRTSRIFLFDPIDIAPITSVSQVDLSNHATQVYPRLFGDNFTDLPLSLIVSGKSSSFVLGEWLQCLTFATVPFPSWAHVNCKVHVTAQGNHGYVVNRAEHFKQNFSWWRSVYTPLGILPIPGFSDARDTSFGIMGYVSFGNNCAGYNKNALTMDSLIEAVAQCVKQADPAKLKAAYESRKARLRQIEIHGQTYWSFMGLGYAKGKDEPAEARVLLYRKYPTWEMKPIDKVVIARKRISNDKWEAVTNYFGNIQAIATATALIVDENPVKAVIQEVDKPALEDCFRTPSRLAGAWGARYLRWNNDALLEAKNRTLPDFVQKRSEQDLLDLIIAAEKEILKISELAESAKNRAQRIVGLGGNPEASRQMSVVCRQRIEIIKVVLRSLRQGLSARQRASAE